MSEQKNIETEENGLNGNTLFYPSLFLGRFGIDRFIRFLLAAALGLALVFTFSCSGDSNDNGGSGGSNSQPNINSGGPVKKEQISGVSQKGPFMRGSTAVLYELDDKFVQTGRSFRDIIADDKGSFDIKINVELVSPYAMLEADGYYRNEVTGNPSTGTIKLYAIADIREKSNVNVNILTHLEYYRVQKLVEEGKSLKDAKKQAQNEILAVFGISGDFKDSEDMSIFGTTDADAALLAISVLLQGNLSEAQFVERLTDFRLGFKETGAWNSNAAKDAMADWAAKANLESIRNKILSWNLSSVVPDFEKFVNNYWLNYNFGACDTGKEGEFKSYNSLYYTCKNGAWEKAKYIAGKCYESKSCLTFTDARDEQSYYSVKIGEQTWMAENLNYVPGSKCQKEDGDIDDYDDYDDYFWSGDIAEIQASCAKYGRLYDWATAMALPDSCNTSSCASLISPKHQGICPSGWYIPSVADLEVRSENGNGEGKLFNINRDIADVWGASELDVGDGYSAASCWITDEAYKVPTSVYCSKNYSKFHVRCLKDDAY